MRKTQWAVMGVSVAVVISCGGPQRGSSSEGEEEVQETVETQEPIELVSPEKYDEIRSSFNMRQTQASRCYRKAVDDGVVKEQAGRVTVALVVTAEGKTRNVRVADTTLNVKAVEDCIVKLVSSWDLPPPGAEIQFSFAYNFEPNW